MAVTLSINIYQNSQNTANNTSNVTVEVVAKWTYGSFNRNEKPGHLVIDGTRYVFASTFNVNETTSGSMRLYSKTVDVSHNSTTGAKTLTCSASYTTGVSSGTVTASASKTLTTISRASVPTLSSSSVDMGGTVTINTNRKNSGFTHDLAYSFAGGSYVSIATGVGASYSWATPDLASKIPNATSGTVTIRCVTKNSSGSTIGTKTVTLTLKVPASVVPVIYSWGASDADANMNLQFGRLIKGRSKIKFNISTDGAKGSTIKSISTTFNGKTYTGASWTSSVITASGSLSLSITVTDSRGRTAKKSGALTVLDYTAPVITAFHAYRCRADGTPDDGGTTMGVRYAYSAPSLNGGNVVNIAVQYKLSTAAEYVAEPIYTGSNLSGSGTLLIGSPAFSADYQYDVRLVVSDYFNETATYVTMLPSGAVILDIKADGTGLSFGSASDRSGIYFGWPAKGQVFGLGEATARIPENADLDDYTHPGVYSVHQNVIAETLTNCPSQWAGTLRVYNAIGSGTHAGPYVYIMQEYRPYPPTDPTYRRLLQTGGDGSWAASAWVEC